MMVYQAALVVFMFAVVLALFNAAFWLRSLSKRVEKLEEADIARFWERKR